MHNSARIDPVAIGTPWQQRPNAPTARPCPGKGAGGGRPCCVRWGFDTFPFGFPFLASGAAPRWGSAGSWRPGPRPCGRFSLSGSV